MFARQSARVLTCYMLFSVAGIALNTEKTKVYGFILPEHMPALSQNSAQKNPDDNALNYDFNGIVALSNCSGSIIRFNISQDDDPALILTNGHCIPRMVEPGTYKYRKPARRAVTLLDHSGAPKGRIMTRSLEYATMTGTDLALYQTDQTYASLRNKFSVLPYLLSDTMPDDGSFIQIISGYWRRGYQCQTEKTISKLLESDWIFTHSIRYSRPGCETIGGTSGSPVILEGTRTVIAVNNTSNENGESCTLNNPCEVDTNGNKTHKKGFSYAQQTYQVNDCLNEERRFDLSVEGCSLTGAGEHL